MELALPDGRIVNVYVDGPADGTPLISHHGTPGAGVPMPSFVRAAAERGLRWVSYSRPGYGESTRAEGRTVADCVRDVAAIADHLGADRFFTSGGSGGGPHTIACAALLPDRVRGCAAIACPAPWGAGGLDWLAGQGPENLEEFAAVLEGPEALETYLEREAPGLSAAKEPQELIDAVGAGLLPDVDRAAITGEYATALIASMNRSVKNGIWGWFDDDMAFFRDWGFSLDGIDVPVALWQGKQDKMVPFAHGEWMAAHVPNARPHLLEDQGHLSLAVASFPQILDDLLEHAHP
ncbi:MAG: alpha/beta hydrolase [Actinobacteria bacterium]|nr:MAG: alpha/beta hydrolase [Actinomycetota bacterium]